MASHKTQEVRDLVALPEDDLISTERKLAKADGRRIGNTTVAHGMIKNRREHFGLAVNRGVFLAATF